MLILKLKLKVEGGGDHFWRRSIDDVKHLILSMIELQNVVSDAHSGFAGTLRLKQKRDTVDCSLDLPYSGPKRVDGKV